MRPLSTVFPLQEVLAAVPEAEAKSFDSTDLKEIVSLQPNTLREMGLSIWHAAMISGQFDLNPRMLSKYVDNGDPNLLKHISHALGQKVVFDINYSFVSIPKQELPEPAALVIVGHLFPNRLHIGDVKLLDPRKPRAGASLGGDQSHESLSLFGTLMTNCRVAAETLGAEKITLTAAHSDLLSPFRNHGFEVEDSEMGRMAMEVGIGFPMEVIL